MALITNLKFGEVDNLSDARFAAGNLAKFIGFSFDPENEAFIRYDKAKEIAGWLSGINIVGEFGSQDLRDVRRAIDQLSLKYVQLNDANNLFSLKELRKVKIIQNLDLIDFRNTEEIEFFIEDSFRDVSYYMLSLYNEDEMEEFLSDWDNEKLVKRLCADFNCVLNFYFTPDNARAYINKYKPYGINLYPSGETNPGEGDFDELIELITELEDGN